MLVAPRAEVLAGIHAGAEVGQQALAADVQDEVAQVVLVVRLAVMAALGRERLRDEEHEDRAPEQEDPVEGEVADPPRVLGRRCVDRGQNGFRGCHGGAPVGRRARARVGPPGSVPFLVDAAGTRSGPD